MPKLPLKKHFNLRFFFERQWLHLLFLLLFVPPVYLMGSLHLRGETFFYLSDQTWFMVALVVPVLHQVVVWLGFKLQLAYGLFTRVFKDKDLFIWGIVFLPLLLLRPLSLIALGFATRGTLFLERSFSLVLFFVMVLPALYTFYSVFRYFGVKRALGGDHFQEKYQKMPLESRGVFKISGNAMYAYGFFLLWAIAFLLASQVALLVAVFQHLYIWIHYLTVEKPHMRRIYETGSQ